MTNKKENQIFTLFAAIGDWEYDAEFEINKNDKNIIKECKRAEEVLREVGLDFSTATEKEILNELSDMMWIGVVDYFPDRGERYPDSTNLINSVFILLQRHVSEVIKGALVIGDPNAGVYPDIIFVDQYNVNETYKEVLKNVSSH